MVWQAIAAGLAAGYLKNKLIDEPREKQNREMQSEIMRYSPWTGMRPDSIAPDTPAASSMLEGAASGLSYGMGERDKANARADKAADREAALAIANPGTQATSAATQAAAPAAPLTKEQAYMLRNQPPQQPVGPVQPVQFDPWNTAGRLPWMDFSRGQ